MVYGRHIFMGYLNDPQRTLETIDNRGWLHTGDFGKIDIDGFLTVVGRAEGNKHSLDLYACFSPLIF